MKANIKTHLDKQKLRGFATNKSVLQGLLKVLQQRKITLLGNIGRNEEYRNGKYVNTYKNHPLFPPA